MGLLRLSYAEQPFDAQTDSGSGCGTCLIGPNLRYRIGHFRALLGVCYKLRQVALQAAVGKSGGAPKIRSALLGSACFGSGVAGSNPASRFSNG
jgi:hypothetical protein